MKYSLLLATLTLSTGAKAQFVCSPDLVVSAQIFVHDSVNSGNPWNGNAQQQVINTIDAEMKRVNQGYCDPSFGNLKVQFTHSVTFITNNELAVAGMNLGDVLNQFGNYWRSGQKNNGSDMGMIYVVNPDGGVGGISALGADVATGNNNGGPALNWGWSNKGDVIAHEVGHFFGADHDGSGDSASCPANGDIMGGGRRLTWSSCSRDEIQRWLQSDRSFYFRKTKDYLNQLVHVGPMGGNGGSPFITGCSQGSYVTQVQPNVASIGNYSSLVDIKYACSNGFNTMDGAGVALRPDSRFRMQGGGWLSGVEIDGQFIGNHDQDKGSMNCPAGMQVAGFFGRKGAALDNLGLLCAPVNSNAPAQVEAIGPVGGSGTSDKFSLQCAPGQTVSQIFGNFADVGGWDSLVNIGIRCSDGQEKQAKNWGGQSFNVAAASIEVYSGDWINGLAIGGNLQGSSDHPSTSLHCNGGKRMTGLFGSSGAAIDNLGLYCY